LVPQFDSSIYKGVFTDTCSLFPDPALVAWSL